MLTHPASLCTLLALVAGCGSSGAPPRALDLPAPPSATAAPVVAVAPAARPELSVGPFSIGQTDKEVRAVAGEPDTERSTAEEAELWRGAGYEPEREIPFLLGFDRVLEYEQAEMRGEVPLFKVFLRRGRVISLTFTAFGVEPEQAQKASYGGCRLTDAEPTIEQRFGAPPAVEVFEASSEYLYPERGVAIIAEESKVQVLQIFEPLPRALSAIVIDRARHPRPSEEKGDGGGGP